MEGYIKYSLLLKERKKARYILTIVAVSSVIIVILASQLHEAYKTVLDTQVEVQTLETITAEHPKQLAAIESTVEDLTEQTRELNTSLLGSESELIKTTEELALANEEITELKSELEILSLDDNNVTVNLQDLRIKCNATEQQLNTLLSGTALAGHGWTFLEVEHKYGINAIALISILKQESGLGRSQANTNNIAGIRSGSGWRSFSSLAECVDYTAKLLGEQYLDANGRFHNGTSIRDVNIKYCVNADGSVDWDWSDKIAIHASNFVAKLEDGE